MIQTSSSLSSFVTFSLSSSSVSHWIPAVDVRATTVSPPTTRTTQQQKVGRLRTRRRRRRADFVGLRSSHSVGWINSGYCFWMALVAVLMARSSSSSFCCGFLPSRPSRAGHGRATALEVFSGHSSRNTVVAGRSTLRFWRPLPRILRIGGFGTTTSLMATCSRHLRFLGRQGACSVAAAAAVASLTRFNTSSSSSSSTSSSTRVDVVGEASEWLFVPSSRVAEEVLASSTERRTTTTTWSRQLVGSSSYPSSRGYSTTTTSLLWNAGNTGSSSSTSATSFRTAAVHLSPTSMVTTNAIFRSFSSSSSSTEPEAPMDRVSFTATITATEKTKDQGQPDLSKPEFTPNTVVADLGATQSTVHVPTPMVLRNDETVDEGEGCNELGSNSPKIRLTEEERRLFALLRRVREETHLTTTLRVAGGWVRDKLLETPQFRPPSAFYDRAAHATRSQNRAGGGPTAAAQRLTSKFLRRRRRLSHPPPPPVVASTTTQTWKTVFGTGSCSLNNNNNNNNKPVDIDIALDDMLGQEFAEHLNQYLSSHGEATHSVGVVLKNPEKSKHLETATMNVGGFWIDFVNLRAEEYTQENSRIPDLMRIGTASEDAYRRDLTINSLFYNIHTGQVEDWTGRGLSDLRQGLVATPLPPLTTLLDDPLRVLRSVRFAARLRFTIADTLVQAAQDVRVRHALRDKVSRERVGSEVDRMFRARDPVAAMRWLHQLQLMDTVFPQMLTGEQGLALLSTAQEHLADCQCSPPLWCSSFPQPRVDPATTTSSSTTTTTITANDNTNENEGRDTPSGVLPDAALLAGGLPLLEDEEGRRLLWYSAFLKPLWNFHKYQDLEASNNLEGGENASRCPSSKTTTTIKPQKKKRKHPSAVHQLLLDDLKRPVRDADAVVKILTAADEVTELMQNGNAASSATMILLSDLHIDPVLAEEKKKNKEEEEKESIGDRHVVVLHPFLKGRRVDPSVEDDPVWIHAMEFRLTCFKMLQKVGPLWRAALILSLSEELISAMRQPSSLPSLSSSPSRYPEEEEEDSPSSSSSFLEYAIEGDVVDETQEELRRGIIERYDIFASALLRLGLIGSWETTTPWLDGDVLQKSVLPNLPKGPAFRQVVQEQMDWIVTHPGVPDREALILHLQLAFPEYV